MGWVAVPREVFEYEMIPWVGRTYAPWLRAAVRPHQVDPHRLVMIPQRIHEVFLQRGSEKAVTPAQLQAMGYPRLPDPRELEERIALELARAPHADVLVGIPGEIQRA